MKVSEDGNCLVMRLSEQDGCRRTVSFPAKVYLMNMLEDVIDPEGAEAIDVSPFEILTVALPMKE